MLERRVRDVVGFQELEAGRGLGHESCWPSVPAGIRIEEEGKDQIPTIGVVVCWRERTAGQIRSGDRRRSGALNTTIRSRDRKTRKLRVIPPYLPNSGTEGDGHLHCAGRGVLQFPEGKIAPTGIRSGYQRRRRECVSICGRDRWRGPVWIGDGQHCTVSSPDLERRIERVLVAALTRIGGGRPA